MEREVRVDADEVGEGSVYWRRGEEAHVRAEVVAACPALAAGAVRDARLQGYALANLVFRRLFSQGYDRSHRLVAEDKGLPDDERAYAPLFVVVDVRAADADSPDLDHYFFGSRFRNGHVFEPDVVRTVHDRRFVFHREASFLVRLLLSRYRAEREAP